MSTDKYEVTRVVDSRIAVHAPKLLIASDGPASSTFQQVIPPDPTSLQPVFQVQMPSQATGLGRVLRWRMRGTIVVTGTGLNALTVANAVAFRQFPLQACCTSAQVQINDSVISLGNLGTYLPALLRAGVTSRSIAGVMTENAAPDVWAEYAAAVGAQGCFEPAADAAYSNFAQGSRTAGITSIAINVANTTATIVFDHVEPVVLPPFAYTAGGYDKAVFGLANAQFTFNLGNIHRMLSMALGAATVTSVALTPSYQALAVNFVTPRDRSLVERPLAYSYGYSSVQAYYSTLTSGALNAGAQTTGSSNTFEFPVVPNKLIVFATYSEVDRANPALSLADCFFPIQAVQCQFGTRSGLLSSASQDQLWEMSARAGAQLPYWLWAALPQFGSAAATPLARAAGGPLVIDVAADLSLPDGLSPGMNTRIQFAVTSITVENQTTANFTAPRLIVLAVTDGILESKDGSTVVMLGGIPGHNDDRFRHAGEITTEQVHELRMDGGYGAGAVGGSFWSWLKGAAKKVVGVAAPIVSAVAPEFAPAAMAAKALVGAGGARMPSRLYRK